MTNRTYFTFTTGLIDAILMRTNHENYGTITTWKNDIDTGGYHFRDQPDTASSYAQLTKENKSKYPDAVFVRNQYKLDERGQKIVFKGRDRTGVLLKSIDECVYNCLEGQFLKPSIDGEQINYDQEFESPFKDAVTQSLLLLKWIIGIQSIQRVPFIQITKEDLRKIEVEHLSTLDIKKVFDLYFKSSLTKNSWEDGVWTIGVGSRDCMISEGPGYVRIRLDYPRLLNNIRDHHKELYAEATANLVNTLNQI